MNAAAVLLAAGAGERLGSGVPKGFVELEGRPLILHALDTIQDCSFIKLAVVTVPEGWEERASELIQDRAQVVEGGETRQRSVAAALGVLEGIGGFDAVVCHDVARPRAPARLFESVLSALREADGAIPVTPVADTLKRVVDGHVAETISREGLFTVQTPQAFRWEALKRSHDDAVRDGVEATDDAALLERSGYSVAVVEGDPRNMKITGPGDLEVASQLGNRGG